MQIDRSVIETILKSNGISGYKWIDPKDIVVSQWVRFKCTFGCPSYGETAVCPPNSPSVEECRRFFSEYSSALIIHFPSKIEDPEERSRWGIANNEKLLEVEREVFKLGMWKAFVTYMTTCRLCGECTADRSECMNKSDSRPSPESLAVDVFSTVRKYDLPIQVVKDRSEGVNRYSILLID